MSLPLKDFRLGLVARVDIFLDAEGDLHARARIELAPMILATAQQFLAHGECGDGG